MIIFTTLRKVCLYFYIFPILLINLDLLNNLLQFKKQYILYASFTIQNELFIGPKGLFLKRDLLSIILSRP
jgi:hypothetical protein